MRSSGNAERKLRARNCVLARQIRELLLKVASLEAKLAKTNKVASCGAFSEIMDDLSELADNTDKPPLLADGLEDALVGYTLNQHHPLNAVYDYGKCVNVLVKRDGMTEEEADEYLQFNTLGAYVGEQGPLFVRIAQ